MLPVIARAFSSVAISVFLHGWMLLRFARNDKSGILQRSHFKENPIISKTTYGLGLMWVFYYIFIPWAYCMGIKYYIIRHKWLIN